MRNVIAVINQLSKLKIYIFLDDQGKLRTRSGKGAITPEVAKLIGENKDELIDYLAKKAAEGVEKERTTIKRLNLEEAELSFAQQRLWMLEQMGEGTSHYNVPAALKLVGSLNVDALEKAFNALLQRHESLRTTFDVNSAGEARQFINKSTQISLEVIDLVGNAQGVAVCIEQEARSTFDLKQDCLLRVKLLKLSESEHILLITLHHITSDGWSMGILINELSAFYSSFVNDTPNTLQPLPIQYSDYAQWQREFLQGEVLEQQVNYWEKQLADLPVVHRLPLDHERAQVQTFTGGSVSSSLNTANSEAFVKLCKEQGATLFMGLQAAFSVLLSRYSNETDIVIGSPIANREQPEVAGLIGFFVNTLVLRSDLSDNPTFMQLLGRSKDMLLDAYAHQQVPFEKLVEVLQPARSRSHSPLFQIMIVLQNNKQGDLVLPGLTIESVEQESDIANFDLTLNVLETTDGLAFNWAYNQQLFKSESIERLAAYFTKLLKTFIQQPEQKVHEIELLCAAEKQRVLNDWRGEALELPEQSCIQELIEAQVERTPDAVAVVFDDTQLTYRELNEQANQLAHHLIEKGVKPEDFVGICIDRSVNMIVGILGILKSGGAYVPLDPYYPAARLSYIVEDANISTVVTQKPEFQRVKELNCLQDNTHAIYLDDSHFFGNYPTTNPDRLALGLQTHNLAYVVYTSGSTGKPKGVLIEHKSLVNLAVSLSTRLDLRSGDRYFQFSTINFDMSVEDIFMALIKGSALMVRSDDWMTSPEHFWRRCENAGVTFMDLPTAFWTEMVMDIDKVPECIRHIHIGGEKLSRAAFEKWYGLPGKKPRLYNSYGPTEVTAITSIYPFTEDSSVAAIGRPIANIDAYILNSALQVVPPGAPGELMLGGISLARGYLNQPELTAEKFIESPFAGQGNGKGENRLYRTGDLVRWLPNGDIEYLGRIDNQVKIRGYRVEPGEIENVILEHEQVKDCLVLAQTTGNELQQLVAYVVPESTDADHNSVIADLRKHLQNSLPDYMVPASFVALEKFPLNVNGKVDRKALPEADFSNAQAEYVEPGTEVESAVCEIWQNLLGIERIGIHDNFFQLGGHSLLVMKVISEISDKYELDFSVKDFFELQTVHEVSELIDKRLLIKKNKESEQDSSLNVMEW